MFRSDFVVRPRTFIRAIRFRSLGLLVNSMVVIMVVLQLVLQGMFVFFLTASHSLQLQLFTDHNVLGLLLFCVGVTFITMTNALLWLMIIKMVLIDVITVSWRFLQPKFWWVYLGGYCWDPKRVIDYDDLLDHFDSGRCYREGRTLIFRSKKDAMMTKLSVY